MFREFSQGEPGRFARDFFFVLDRRHHPHSDVDGRFIGHGVSGEWFSLRSVQWFHDVYDGLYRSLDVHADSASFAFGHVEHLRLLAAALFAPVLSPLHSVSAVRLEERLGGAQRDREAVVRPATPRGVRSPGSLARHGRFAALFGLWSGQIGHHWIGEGRGSLRGEPVQLHATLFCSNSPRCGAAIRFGARDPPFPSHIRFVFVRHRNLPERNAPRAPAVERGDGPDVLRVDSDVFNADFDAISRVQAGHAAYFRGSSAAKPHHSQRYPHSRALQRGLELRADLRRPGLRDACGVSSRTVRSKHPNGDSVFGNRIDLRTQHYTAEYCSIRRDQGRVPPSLGETGETGETGEGEESVADCEKCEIFEESGDVS